MSPEITTYKCQNKCKSGLNVNIFEKKHSLSGSQDLEIFFLPAVPTERLDGHKQPHFHTSLHSVIRRQKNRSGEAISSRILRKALN